MPTRGTTTTTSPNGVLDSDQARFGVNRNEYTASRGGPHRENKTSFSDCGNSNSKQTRNAYTPGRTDDCARNGIFRYYDNWFNGNFNTPDESSRHEFHASGRGLVRPSRAACDEIG